MQGRAVHGAAGDAAIVIVVRDKLPAKAGLRGNEGRTGLPLGIEGVELLVEPFVGRLAGIDCAAKARGGAHSPKNLGPDQCAPVMRLAMAESDR